MKILTNVVVYGLLVAITAGELAIVNLSFLTRSVTVTTLIGLAGVKAVLVAAFFQQLKYEPRSLSTILLAGIVIASVLLAISFLQLHSLHA